MAVQVIVDARVLPYKGTRPSVEPATLAPGELSWGQNIRRDSRAVAVRPAMGTAVVNQAAAGALWLGATSVYVNGYQQMAYAFRTLATSTVFDHMAVKSGSNWLQITSTTATGAKYGPTGLGNGGNSVAYAVLRDTGATGYEPFVKELEYLVVNNDGQVAPRVISCTSSAAPGTSDVAIGFHPTALKGEGLKSVAVPGTCKQIRLGGTYGANWTLHTAGTTTADYYALGYGSGSPIRGEGFVVGTGSVTLPAGSTATPILVGYCMADKTSGDLAAGLTAWPTLATGQRQFWIVGKFDRANFVRQHRWYLQRCNSQTAITQRTAHLIYDPTGLIQSNSPDPVIVDGEGGVSLVAFDIGHLGLTVNDTYTGLGLAYIHDRTAAISTTVTGQWSVIYGWGFSGGVPGGAQFGASLFNAGSRCESAGVLCEDVGGARGTDAGFDPSCQIEMPVDPRVFYNYKITALQPDVATGTGQEGVEWLLVYMRNWNAQDYRIVAATAKTVGVATNTAGGWSWANSTTANSLISHTVSTSAVGARKLPPADARSIPYARRMKAGATRSFFGGCYLVENATVSPALGTIMVSEENHQFRFRAITDLSDPASAVTVKLPGQVVRGVEAPTAPMNPASMLVWTEDGVYEVGGVEASQLAGASKISAFGTLAPNSICEYAGDWFFVDQFNQVRSLGQTIGSYSTEAVENFLRTCSNYGHAATIDQDRYILALSSDGTSGTGTGVQYHALVFDLRGGFWESIDKFNSAINIWQFLPYRDTDGQNYPVVINNAGEVRKYRSALLTDSDTYGIEVRLDSPEYSGQDWGDVAGGRVYMVGETVTTAVTATTQRIPRGGTTATASLSVATSGGLTNTWDKLTATADAVSKAGAVGPGMKFGFRCALPAGYKILSLGGEIEGRASSRLG